MPVPIRPPPITTTSLTALVAMPLIRFVLLPFGLRVVFGQLLPIAIHLLMTLESMLGRRTVGRLCTAGCRRREIAPTVLPRTHKASRRVQGPKRIQDNAPSLKRSRHFQFYV